MELAAEILSDITVHMKYARYLPDVYRRETYAELVDRNKAMHIKRYPDLKEEIEDLSMKRRFSLLCDRCNSAVNQSKSLQIAFSTALICPLMISGHSGKLCSFY